MITQEQLKKLLNYNPETGDLTWVNDAGRHGRIKAGTIAGSIDNVNGYRIIQLDGVPYRSHRLIWLHVYGEFPKDQIDHRNHIRADNRLCNLREATNKENSRNQSMRINNTSGSTGVYWFKRDCIWESKIKIDGVSINLGRHKDINAAILTRRVAEFAYGFHPNHGGGYNA